MVDKKNDPNYILNPKTKRWVLRTGKVGKEILAEMAATKKSKSKSSSPLKSTKSFSSSDIAKMREIVKSSGSTTKRSSSVSTTEKLSPISKNETMQALKSMSNKQLAQFCRVNNLDCKKPIKDIVQNYRKLVGKSPLSLDKYSIEKLLDCCDQAKFICRKKVLDWIYKNL